MAGTRALPPLPWIPARERRGELPVGNDVIYALRYGNFGNPSAEHVSISLKPARGLSFLRADRRPTILLLSALLLTLWMVFRAR